MTFRVGLGGLCGLTPTLAATLTQQELHRLLRGPRLSGAEALEQSKLKPPVGAVGDVVDHVDGESVRSGATVGTLGTVTMDGVRPVSSRRVQVSPQQWNPSHRLRVNSGNVSIEGFDRGAPIECRWKAAWWKRLWWFMVHLGCRVVHFLNPFEPPLCRAILRAPHFTHWRRQHRTQRPPPWVQVSGNGASPPSGRRSDASHFKNILRDEAHLKRYHDHLAAVRAEEALRAEDEDGDDGAALGLGVEGAEGAKAGAAQREFRTTAMGKQAVLAWNSVWEQSAEHYHGLKRTVKQAFYLVGFTLMELGLTADVYS